MPGIKLEDYRVKLDGFKCGRCGHEWMSRDKEGDPTVCPKCKSAYWNKPRKRRLK